MKYKIWLILVPVLLLTACGAIGAQDKEAAAMKEAAYTAPKTGDYDSADTAVIVDIKEKEHKITLLNLILGRHYTLAYDGATKIYSRHEEALTMAQLAEGDIVDVTFLKENRLLNSIRISPQSWEEGNVAEFSVSNKDGDFVIPSGQYEITDDLVILSDGEEIEMIDLNAKDEITVKGIGHTIHSIIVDKGHGYLRLANDEYFVGGWIEVGSRMIHQITQDMLLTVPEGTYGVLVTNGGSGGMKEVSVNRGKETTLDVGDLKGEEVKIGAILFALTPSTAQVYIDGDKVDTGGKVEMEYGIHQMIVRADGYKTITQYIKVGQAYASLAIELEKSEDEDGTQEKDDAVDTDYTYGKLDNSVSTNNTPTQNTNTGSTNKNDTSVSGNSNSNSSQVTDTAGNYKIRIEQPEGVEVYLDGNYIGIAPVSFKKDPGRHEITLRKNGYVTRSYSIYIKSTDLKKDETTSFSELVKESGA